MKGFTKDGKFHPITDYKKGTRKSRDQQVKLEGIKIRKARTITTDSTSDMAIEILEKTNDGDDLGNAHLSLVQGAVNDSLTEKGIDAFKKLHSEVKSGMYHKPYFHGIPNMTQDQEGFVYWRGEQVEHYSYNDWEEEEFSARELAEVIKELESMNVKVTGANIMDHYDIFHENHPEWKRSQYLVQAFDKDGRSTGSEWIRARDIEGAEKEFIRQNKAGSFREEYKFDKLDAIPSAEINRRQNADWEQRTGVKLKR